MPCFKYWPRCKNAKTWKNYKRDKKYTKKIMSKARSQAFDRLYQY